MTASRAVSLRVDAGQKRTSITATANAGRELLIRIAARPGVAAAAWGLNAGGRRNRMPLPQPRGARRIAGQREGLAAATAPVDLAPLARAAGLGHPRRAAEPREGRRVVPDFREAGFADGRKAQSRKGLRRMARQHLARRGDVQKTPAPAAHASLRAMRMIVR